MTKGGPTKRMLAFLRWAEAQGEFSTWSSADSDIRRRAVAAGYIERSGKSEPGVLGLAYFRVSAAGREALEQSR